MAGMGNFEARPGVGINVGQRFDNFRQHRVDLSNPEVVDNVVKIVNSKGEGCEELMYEPIDTDTKLFAFALRSAASKQMEGIKGEDDVLSSAELLDFAKQFPHLDDEDKLSGMDFKQYLMKKFLGEGKNPAKAAEMADNQTESIIDNLQRAVDTRGIHWFPDEY